MGAGEVFNRATGQALRSKCGQVNTLAALGEMAATVAHEIRNLLGGIAGYAGMLERDLSSEDPNRRLVHRIGRGRVYLTSSLSLLTYTRPLRLNAYPVNLVE